jgi:glycosyltransferase involved in cell wall biosynthesis
MPNREGLLWFWREVWPEIKRQIKGVKLVVVGGRMDKQLARQLVKDETVKLVGEVASLTPYYRQADMMVAPIFSGSGVRMKILSALAGGVPVVSTWLGREGIGGNRDDIGIVTVGPGKQAFADAVSKLMADKPSRMKLSRQAVAFMRANYNSAKTKRALARVGL